MSSSNADWSTQILNFVERRGYKPVKPVMLARRMGVPKKEQNAFRDAFTNLLDKRKLAISRTGRVEPKRVSSDREVVGQLRRRANSGTVRWPSEKDPQREVYIDSRDLDTAVSGDTVRVRLTNKRRSGGQRCGRVVEVLERARVTFVGRYTEVGGQAVVELQGRNVMGAISVGDPGAKGVKPGDMVVVDVVQFPSDRDRGQGVISKVLGDRGKAGVDTQTVIVNYGLPTEFPEAAMDEAREQAATFDPNDLDEREDLTNDVILTIDPTDARDFDDAISLTRSDDGHWHLGVHIADVSHFVVPGSPLDEEAALRATSVYLPTMVIPMLPEIISNGLASLQEGKRRYTKTCFIEFTPEGTPVHVRLSRTVIENKKRLRYEEVMPIINDQPDAIEVAPEIELLLKNMYELAMILRGRRFERGALELSNPEIDLIFNDDMQVVGAQREHDDPSHDIIEEFMLAANIATAVKLHDLGWPFARRSHPDPDPMRLRKFKSFVEALGYELPQEQNKLALQSLLNAVKDTPEERAVNMALLKSMQQAIYTGQVIGHYALSEPHYCHFTSPIRRYPDLMVHRLIEAIVLGKKNHKGPSGDVLERECDHCSDMSRRAEAAERELTTVKLLGYYEDRIGETMKAVITGVERFGLFCQGVDLPVEGLIPIRSLGDEYFDFEENLYRLSGRNGETFQLGDELTVKVAAVDMDRRQLEFAIDRNGSRGDRKGASRKRPSKGRHGKPGNREKSSKKQKRASGSHGGKKRAQKMRAKKRR